MAVSWALLWIHDRVSLFHAPAASSTISISMLALALAIAFGLRAFQISALTVWCWSLSAKNVHTSVERMEIYSISFYTGDLVSSFLLFISLDWCRPCQTDAWSRMCLAWLACWQRKRGKISSDRSCKASTGLSVRTRLGSVWIDTLRKWLILFSEYVGPYVLFC